MRTEIIKKYYSFVDEGLDEELLALFSDNATYVRAGKVISGKEELRKFYLKDRGLIGRHDIVSVQDLDGYVVVEGEFNGENSRKEDIHVPFADIFEIEGNLIVQRRTYLGVMNQMIE